jgi:hypothetical protein
MGQYDEDKNDKTNSFVLPTAYQRCELKLSHTTLNDWKGK